MSIWKLTKKSGEVVFSSTKFVELGDPELIKVEAATREETIDFCCGKNPYDGKHSHPFFRLKGGSYTQTKPKGDYLAIGLNSDDDLVLYFNDVKLEEDVKDARPHLMVGYWTRKDLQGMNAGDFKNGIHMFTKEIEREYALTKTDRGVEPLPVVYKDSHVVRTTDGVFIYELQMNENKQSNFLLKSEKETHVKFSELEQRVNEVKPSDYCLAYYATKDGLTLAYLIGTGLKTEHWGQTLVHFKKATLAKEEVALYKLMNSPELLCSELYKPCFSIDEKKDFKLEDLRKTDLLLKAKKIKLEHPLEECACYVYKGSAVPLTLDMAHEKNTPVLKLVKAPRNTNPHFNWKTGELASFEALCEEMQSEYFNQDDYVEIKRNTLYVDESHEVYFFDTLGRQVLNLRAGETIEQTMAKKVDSGKLELKPLDNQSELMLKAASMKYWSLARVSAPTPIGTIRILWKEATSNPILLLEKDLYPEALFYFNPVYEIKAIGGVFVCDPLK